MKKEQKKARKAVTVAHEAIEPATPAKVVTKPAEAKPAEAKPAEAKPAEAKPAEAKPATEKPKGLGAVARIEAGKPATGPKKVEKQDAPKKVEKKPAAITSAKDAKQEKPKQEKPKTPPPPAVRKTDGETVEALIKRHVAEIGKYIAGHQGKANITTGAGVTIDPAALIGYAALRREQREAIMRRLDYDPAGEAQYWYTATKGNIIATVAIFGGAPTTEDGAYRMMPGRFARAFKALFPKVETTPTK